MNITTMTKTKTGDHVVITTSKRGIFFGRLISESEDSAELENVQMCVHYSRATRGVIGLAAIGPQDGSRVGPPAPYGKAYGVTGVWKCSDEAVAAWKAQPWS